MRAGLFDFGVWHGWGAAGQNTRLAVVLRTTPIVAWLRPHPNRAYIQGDSIVALVDETPKQAGAEAHRSAHYSALRQAQGTAVASIG